MKHSFTSAYCHWANGTVERLCREVLRIAEAFLSELRLSEGQWSTIEKGIQKAVNQSPAEHLGKDNDGKMLCSMKSFTVLNLTALLIRPSPLPRFRDLKVLGPKKRSQNFSLKSVKALLVQIHKNMATRKQHQQTQAQMRHNAKTKVLPIKFEIGDFGMVRTHAKYCKKYYRYGEVQWGWLRRGRICCSKWRTKTAEVNR